MDTEITDLQLPTTTGDRTPPQNGHTYTLYKEGVDYEIISEDEHDGIEKADDENRPLLLDVQRERFNSDPPVARWRVIGYALGGLPRTALMYVTHVYFTAFLLEVAAVAPLYTSMILLIARCCNALSDPFVGYLVSHSADTRLGKFAPWMLGATPFVVVFYVLLWWVPPWTNQAGLVFYYMGLYWLFGLSATCYGVPFVSSIMAMSNSQHQRDSIISARMTCEVAGSIVGLAIHAVWLAVGVTYEWPTQRAYMGSAFTLVALYLVLALVAFFSIEERYWLRHDDASGRKFWKPYLEILRFRPYSIFAGCILCIYIGYSVVLGIYTLYFQYVFYAPRIFPFCAVILFTCAAGSVPIWNRLMKKFGKKTILLVSTSMMIVVFWTHFFLRFHIALVIVVVVIAGCLVGCAQLTPASMIPDIIAIYSVDHGHGKEPMFYSITVFLDTFGNAICSALTTLALSWAGYQGGLPASEQPHAVEITLRVIVGGFPVITFLIALVLLIEYPITEKYRLKMRDRIKESMCAISRQPGATTAAVVDNENLGVGKASKDS